MRENVMAVLAVFGVVAFTTTVKILYEMGVNKRLFLSIPNDESIFICKIVNVLSSSFAMMSKTGGIPCLFSCYSIFKTATHKCVFTSTS